MTTMSELVEKEEARGNEVAGIGDGKLVIEIDNEVYYRVYMKVKGTSDFVVLDCVTDKDWVRGIPLPELV